MNKFNLPHNKISQSTKKEIFQNKMNLLVKEHSKNSKDYKNFLKKINYDFRNKKMELFPFLPVRIFKEIDLMSVKKNKIVRVLQSSGTSGSAPSKIFLDKINSKNQMIALNEIVKEIIDNNKRLPMLIFDKKPNKNDVINFNARLAAIHGFSLFGKEPLFLIDNEDNIKIRELNEFLSTNKLQNFLMFGFTSLIFKHLIQSDIIKKLNKNFSNGILIHGGGWKKLENLKISNYKFKKILKENYDLDKVYNYYGLVEQTGSIFFECQKCSNFVTSKYSEILIRDKQFKVLDKNKKGLVQLLSLLPSSYPGHSILTDDIGEIKVNKECECFNKGTQFVIHGRVIKSELRGCSDTI